MKYKFKNLETCMIRTPSLPIEMHFNLLGDKNKKNNTIIDSKNNQFNEAIYTASEDLYSSLQDYLNNHSVRDKDYFFNSLYKYFIRSTSRSTPFGLFSAVKIGTISNNKTDLKLSSQDISRFAMVDLQWLFGVVFELESKHTNKLLFKINPSANVMKNRVYIMDHVNQKEEASNDIESKSIRFAKSYEIVKEVCLDYVSFEDIVNSLKNEYPNIKPQVFKQYVRQLIKNDYLISNLRPPLTKTDQLSYIINILKQQDIDASEFIKLQELISIYNSQKTSNHIKAYKNIISHMEKIFKSKYYLIIDSSMKYENSNINSKSLKSLNEYLNLILKYTLIKKDNNFEEYKMKFLEKYGQNRCVPLLELVDNDLGLGFPTEETSSNKADEYKAKTNAYFNKKYTESILKQEDEIEIIEEELKKYIDSNEPSYEEIPKSLDINLGYTQKNNEDIFEIRGMSKRAGNMFGRFSHIMENPKSFFEKINDCERTESNDGDYLYCEISFFSSKHHSLNVMQNESGCDYEIALSTTNSKEKDNQILLDDILVYHEGKNLFLKSKSKNKKLIVITTNMLTPKLMPNICKFLTKVCNSDNIDLFSWAHTFNKNIYSPAIRYKNIFLKQKSWQFNLKDLNLVKKCGLNEFKEKFNEFRDLYKISKYVTITEFDNKLLLNLENEQCLSILQQELNKSKEILRLEHFDETCNHPVTQDNNSYCCELVVPFITINKEKKEVPKEKSINDFAFDEGISSSSSDRLKTPFDEWLYFKIYGVNKNIEEIISTSLYPFLENLIKENKIDEYFFIRYKEFEPQIRLRIKADGQKLFAVYPKFKELFDNLIEHNLIRDYCIDCYSRELERYGGLKLMSFAETVFFEDSRMVEKILLCRLHKEIRLSDEILSMIIILHEMKQFELSLNDMYSFMGCSVQSNEFRDVFKKDREKYINTIIDFLNGETDNEEIKKIIDILNNKNESLNAYLKQLQLHSENPDKDKLIILNSFIHMTMNRLFGPTPDYEKKLKTITRYGLYAVYCKNKNLSIIKINSKVNA